jgi:hypothetical protein
MPKTKNKTHRKKQYSKEFFRKSFPPNHNPLIGTLHADTLHNVHDAIAVLQEITVNSNEGLMPSESINTGYYFLTDCILTALRFELYHRKESKS